MKDWAREKVERYHYAVTIFQVPMATDHAVKLLRAERARARRVVRQVFKDTLPGEGYDKACAELLRRLQ